MLTKSISTIALLAISLAAAAADGDNDKPVRFLVLGNQGSYVIESVELKWQAEGDKSGNKGSKTFNYAIKDYEALCVDLGKVDGLHEGDEVWLIAHIALGETESCRKSNKRIYDPNGRMQYYKMGGQTRSNNRCKISDSLGAKYGVTHGNSNGC